MAGVHLPSGVEEPPRLLRGRGRVRVRVRVRVRDGERWCRVRGGGVAHPCGEVTDAHGVQVDEVGHLLDLLRGRG